MTEYEPLTEEDIPRVCASCKYGKMYYVGHGCWELLCSFKCEHHSDINDSCDNYQFNEELLVEGDEYEKVHMETTGEDK